MNSLSLPTLLTIVAIVVTPWIWNAAKFAGCDFESNYKCEIIHGAGIVVPPAAWITVWFDSDS